MWFIYESSSRRLAVMSVDAYPVPEFCDASTAGSFKGTNRYNEAVKYLAAKVDEGKLDVMPDHLREDYELAVLEGRSVGDFAVTPMKASR